MTSLGGSGIAWPSVSEVVAVLLLQGGYNTTVVMLGVTLLGIAAGTVGTFAVLRKRAMMSDTMSHATLPGIGLAFLAAVALGAEGRSLPVLLGGAAVAGVVGVAVVHGIARHTRLPEDAAMGAVLSVFFGLGFVVLSYIQTLGTGAEGGISKFIYGQTAAMSAGDAITIAAVAAGVVVATLLLFKEFRLVCFDPEFAEVQGWPVSAIDLLMMALVVVVTVIGLQAVGLILIIALVIIPAAAARFWTDRLWLMTLIAAGFGAVSGYVGAALSALMDRFPAGGIIVLVAGALFVISLFLAPGRGVLAGSARLFRLRLEVEAQHVLRGVFEQTEARGAPLTTPVSTDALAFAGTWSAPWRTAVLLFLWARGLIARPSTPLTLTDTGAAEAWRQTRSHRLWEAYFARHVAIAPGRVDRLADMAEHVLDPGIVARLEEQLARDGRLPMPGGLARPVRE